MKLRDSIFDSHSEREVFRSLKSRWSPMLSLYPLLPLSKIIEIGPQELEKNERDYFYKTDVDYTFCQGIGRPILSIEFDGLGGGFSRDGVYIPKRDTVDPYRELKMDFKLKVAKAVDYPLMVVSFDEAQPLDEGESLTVLDGMVGQVLKKQEFHKLLGQFFEASREEIEEMPEYFKYEYCQDLVDSAEVQAELDMDPIAKKGAQYLHFATSLAHSKGQRLSWSEEYLNDPPLPEFRYEWDIETLEARIEACKNAVWVGRRITVDTPKGEIKQEGWVRNFEGFGVNPGSIAGNIAEYLAFKRAYSLLARD